MAVSHCWHQLRSRDRDFSRTFRKYSKFQSIIFCIAMMSCSPCDASEVSPTCAAQQVPGATTDDIVLGLLAEGSKAQQDGRPWRAIECFSRVLALKVHRPEAFLERGRSFFSIGAYRRALDEATLAIEAAPNLAGGYAARGSAYSALSMPGEALVDFTHAIALNPEQPRYPLARSLAERALGQFAGALKDLDLAVTLGVSESEVAAVRESIIRVQKDIEARINAFPASDGHVPSWLGDLRPPLALNATPPLGVVPSKAVGRSHDCSSFYPIASYRLLESGRVRIGYDVDENGAITNVKIKQSSGSPRIDQAAILCVSSAWRNLPASVDGLPVPTPGHEAIIDFHLDGPGIAPDLLLRAQTQISFGEYREALQSLELAKAKGLGGDMAAYYSARLLAHYLLGDFAAARADVEESSASLNGIAKADVVSLLAYETAEHDHQW